MLTEPEYGVSNGTISIRASMRSSIRKSMGEMPSVLKASISSLTCVVPSWAAKAARCARRDDAGHRRPHLAHHADRHQVDNEYLRPDQARWSAPR